MLDRSLVVFQPYQLELERGAKKWNRNWMGEGGLGDAVGRSGMQLEWVGR